MTVNSEQKAARIAHTKSVDLPAPLHGNAFLMLSRELSEGLRIGSGPNAVRIYVKSIGKGGRLTLAVDAPKDIRVLRVNNRSGRDLEAAEKKTPPEPAGHGGAQSGESPLGSRIAAQRRSAKLE